MFLIIKINLKFKPQKHLWQDHTVPLVLFPVQHSSPIRFAMGIQRRLCVRYISVCKQADQQDELALFSLYSFASGHLALIDPAWKLSLPCALGAAAVGGALSQLVAEAKQLCSSCGKSPCRHHQE